MKRLLPAAASFFLFLNVFAQKKEPYQLINTFHIQSPGGWDYITTGPHNRLYVSHSTQVNILDKTTGDSVGVIENTTGVHGIAFDVEHEKGFTSNGRLNNVSVFDLKTLSVITQINTGENPDAIMFEPFLKKIITCNGRGKSLSIIDPVTYTVTNTIDLGGKPETAVSGEDGKLYVNIEDKSEIIVVDLTTMTVTAHWPLTPAEEPSGLSIDRKTKRLFAGCGNSLLAVVDLGTGKMVKTFPIGDGCDGTAFDASMHLLCTSNGEGTLSVFHENNNGDLDFISNVPTQRGARTITVDPSTHLIYLPTADFEPSDPNSKGRPKMIPGTFKVLVFAPSKN